MPVHTAADEFQNTHVKEGGQYKAKGEQIIFQDTKDSLYYRLQLDDGVLTPVLLNPQPDI